uniref:Uncharacterized protein n=1 Tax=Tanacetum cinerariifolium TaxID=118510 RepID=A0A6L2KFD9_TANCI|nr:hypothetical protein [Tanacetum cinerariifolium]
MNYPLAEAFTKTPEVLYQNVLREFWCTAIAYDPNPPANDFEEHPLKEYKIKFTLMNGTNVSHPFSKAAKAELAKIATDEVLIKRTHVLKTTFPVAWRILFTFVIQDQKFGSLHNIMSNSNFIKDPSKVTDIELMASMIVVKNLETLVSTLPFSEKKKVRKSQIVSQPKPKKQGPEASEHLDKEKEIKKVAEEAKLLAIRKPELIMAIHEEASKAGIDPKILKSAKGG